MSEMKTPWKKLQNKDYLGECDFLPGQEITVTIASVTTAEVIGDGGKKSTKPIMKFVEPVKPLITNTVNFKRITKLLGSRYIEDWIGKQVILYGDPTVTFGKEVVGGVRVKDKLPTNSACSDCGQIIQSSGKFTAVQISTASRNQYGRTLCIDCAKQAKEAQTDGK
jgi:ribosomal protein L34E